MSYPFRSVTLRPNGDINPCCLHEEYVIGNINDCSIEEAFLSDKAQAFRDQFLEKEISICGVDIKARNCHLWDKSAIESPYKIKAIDLKKLDLRLNGQCNIKCIMCDTWKQENGTYNEDNFWKEVEDNIIPNLNEIKFLGGEPLIQSDTFKFLELLRLKNPKCKVSLWTNGYWKLTKKRFDILNQTNFKMITISLDGGSKKVFEHIRKGVQFEIVIENIKKILEIRNSRSEDQESFFVQTDLCFQKDNLFDIENYILLGKELGVFSGFFFLYNPREYCSLELDKEKKKSLFFEIKDLFIKYQNPKLMSVLRPLMFSLGSDFISKENINLNIELQKMKYSLKKESNILNYIDF